MEGGKSKGVTTSLLTGGRLTRFSREKTFFFFFEIQILYFLLFTHTQQRGPIIMLYLFIIFNLEINWIPPLIINNF